MLAKEKHKKDFADVSSIERLFFYHVSVNEGSFFSFDSALIFVAVH